MILWSVVIDLCSFIRDIDSLGRVCVCTHRCNDVVSEGEARSYIYDSYAFTRLSMFRDVLESRLGNGQCWEGRMACVVQYSCLCQYEFVYSNVEYLSTYTTVLGNII